MRYVNSSVETANEILVGRREEVKNLEDLGDIILLRGVQCRDQTDMRTLNRAAKAKEKIDRPKESTRDRFHICRAISTEAQPTR